MRTMAKSTVVAGTAAAVSGGVARVRQTRADGDATPPEGFELGPDFFEEALADPVPSRFPSAAMGDDLLAALAKLGQMKSSGFLTDAEFSAAKAMVLGI